MPLLAGRALPWLFGVVLMVRKFTGWDTKALSQGKGGLFINVHAQPGARHPQLRGMHGDAVKIAVKEAAQDGRANAAIIRFIAEGINLPVADVELSSGLTSRRKRVFLHGDSGELTHKLELWLNAE
jgi:hypothetical protein